nr:Chain C, SARS-CoV-2 S fusion peptide [Severe acute respiratory syndrome coronavirus 2]7U0E_D Chain D, SARS-CoV-2 S fusion peptide [Severe acute respiratory syndrome coronavirus 2]
PKRSFIEDLLFNK